jgi:hypothetical protein
MISLLRKTKSYSSCKTIPMESFYEMMESNNVKWLVIGYDYDNDVSINTRKREQLKEEWKVLFDEYLQLKNDQSVINNLRKRMKIAELRNKLFWGGTWLRLFINNQTKENAKGLGDWGFKIDSTKDINKEVERIIRSLKSLKTRINIEVSKYEKRLEKASKQEKNSIDDQVVNVAKVLDLKFPIDLKETTISRWVSYTKQAESIIKKRKNGTNN